MQEHREKRRSSVMSRILMSSSPSSSPPPKFSPLTTSFDKPSKSPEQSSSLPPSSPTPSVTDYLVRDSGNLTPLLKRPNPPEFPPLLIVSPDEDQSNHFFPTSSSSNPIAIPSKTTRRGSTPTSPLTGREEKEGNYFPFDEAPSPVHRRKTSSNPFQPNLTRRGQLKLPLKMRSERSPNLRPSSPTASTARPTMALPKSPRSRVGKTGSPLQLPGLPRFHPANYQSDSGSTHNTPVSGVYSGSNTPNLHPTRQQSDVQRHLHAYQREMIASTSRNVKRHAQDSSAKPTSPRLVPLGSPGPITPLELGDEEGGYLVAGARQGQEHRQSGQQELVDQFIRNETRPRLGLQASRATRPRTPGRR